MIRAILESIDEAKRNTFDEGWYNSRTGEFEDAPGGSHTQAAEEIVYRETGEIIRDESVTDILLSKGWVRVSSGGFELDPKVTDLNRLKRFVEDKSISFQIYIDFTSGFEAHMTVGDVLDADSWAAFRKWKI